MGAKVWLRTRVRVETGVGLIVGLLVGVLVGGGESHSQKTCHSVTEGQAAAKVIAERTR